MDKNKESNILIFNKIQDSHFKEILNTNDTDKIKIFLEIYKKEFLKYGEEIGSGNNDVCRLCEAFLCYKNNLIINFSYKKIIKYDYGVISCKSKYTYYTVYDLINYYYGETELIKFKKWLYDSI